MATHFLSVEYAVFAAHVFERMVRERQRITEPSAHNPHADPILFTLDALEDDHACASVRFSAEQCAGHFDGCPAVPVARLVHGLGSLAGHLFQQRKRDPLARYVVTCADAHAQRLAFADDELVLRADHVRDRGSEVCVRGYATLRDGTRIADIELCLAPAD